ncbi:MAG: c-type cytochrome [Gammaproteobacteria bacterium]|nr:c-type cytochrome [Gammaproteobacteria bacterium]
MKIKQVCIAASFATAMMLSMSGFAGGEPEGTLAVSDDSSAMVGMSPRERVASTPKGELKNPYTDNEEMITAGKDRYFGNSCNGCHGGGAGGGMCPPISNEVFVYGSDDDTLFRLVTLGSDDLQKAGYFRKGMEGVVGPMPPYGDIIKTDDELWKIIAWLRTQYKGDIKRRDW